MNLDVVVAFGIYFSILGIIGFLAYRKSKHMADFALGSRSLSYWVTALAAHASDMSGWLFMGFPAAVYSQGLIQAWTAIGLTFFMYLNWKFVAPKLRTLTENYKSSTLSTFFEERFGDRTGSLRIISALFCLLFFTFYISAGFVTLGHLFESIFGISYNVGLMIGSLAIFYILLGGYLSIAWVDFFQGIFLLGMILLVPTVAFFHTGCLTNIVTSAHAHGISLDFLPHSLNHFISILVLAAGWGLGYFGQPHIVTKFMGIRNVKETRKAQYVGLTWQCITLAAAISVGLIGLAYFPAGIENKDLIFITMTKSLFSPFFAGIILCAILASAINVIGAQVLASTSILAEDFYKRFTKGHGRAAQHTQWASHVSVIVICALALVYALINQEQSIYDLVHYAWTGLGCSFGPLMLVALHSKMRNVPAALAALITGGTIAALLPWLGISISHTMLIGYATSFIVLAITQTAIHKKA